MIAQLRRKPGASEIGTTVGDFAETVVGREFSLVYVVYNSISNLLEQSEWVATCCNAARHLSVRCVVWSTQPAGVPHREAR